jgi:Tat protein secretion system quality control protein TatD with DNase activity
VISEQLAVSSEQLTVSDELLAMLEALAAGGRLAGVGETGFDLYNAAFRETEKIQDELFAGHVDVALRYELPLVIHVRRAMHKIFACTAALKKCRAVIFHSWPGTAGEGEALLRRGVNAFFSFGTTIMLNHREAMRCCAVFPSERILTETDAPFQPLRMRCQSKHGVKPCLLKNAAWQEPLKRPLLQEREACFSKRRGDEELGMRNDFSSYADLGRILETAAALRREAGTDVSCVKELEKVVEGNFRAAFLVSENRR